LEVVKHALEVIKKLDPRPGAALQQDRSRASSSPTSTSARWTINGRRFLNEDDHARNYG